MIPKLSIVVMLPMVVAIIVLLFPIPIIGPRERKNRLEKSDAELLLQASRVAQAKLRKAEEAIASKKKPLNQQVEPRGTPEVLKLKTPKQKYALLEFTADAIKVGMMPRKKDEKDKRNNELTWKIPANNLDSLNSSNRFLLANSVQAIINFLDDFSVDRQNNSPDNRKRIGKKSEKFETPNEVVAILGELKAGCKPLGMNEKERTKFGKFLEHIEKIVLDSNFKYTEEEHGIQQKLVYLIYYHCLLKQLEKDEIDTVEQIDSMWLSMITKKKDADLKNVPKWLATTILGLKENIEAEAGIEEEVLNADLEEWERFDDSDGESSS